jgi:hypothetical protein
LQVAELPEPQQPAPAQQFAAHAVGVAGGQVQLPLWQDLGDVQTFPQAPQFALSLAALVQASAQQSWPAAHAFPQVWQFAASVCRSKQPAGPQSERFALAHAQFPAGQAVFPGSVQLTPQVPQFCGSLRSVQAGCDETALVHSTGSGAKQLQAPPWHCEPAKVQTVAQSPQWARSTAVFTQVPPQSVAVGPVHWHTPAAHEASPLATPGPRQECRHAPQLATLVWRSTQLPQHVCPAPHTTPQPPQFDGSLLTSTQWSPQRIDGTWQESSLGLQPARRARARRVARARFTLSMIPRPGAPVHGPRRAGVRHGVPR